MSRPIRVLLVDDHAVLRAGLRALLKVERDIEVVGEAGNGNEASNKVGLVKPDIVVMDLMMPGMQGLDAIEQINTQYPGTKVLVLTMYAEDEYVLRAAEAGASGYVLKSSADVDLIEAIRKIYEGEPYFYPQAMQVLLKSHSRAGLKGEETEDDLDLLSHREYKVLVMTIQGYSSREIGERLFISSKTVDTYRQRLMRKLNLEHRADLFQFALRKGLLERSDFLQDILEGQAPPNPSLFGTFAPTTDSLTWDDEVDVIVVGSGTGMLAAIRAADAGLRVLVLEKADVVGGTTGISGGGLWVPNNFRMQEAGIDDSIEEALDYIHHATFGQADPKLARTFVENCNPTIDFLREIGIDWVFLPTFNDYHPNFPGGKPRGRSLRPVTPEYGEGEGELLVQQMAQAGLQRGVKVHLSTAAKRLVVNERGRIVGVIASKRDGDVNYKAQRGVVLAAGGFDYNQEMVDNFLRGPLYHTSAVHTNTGDGHLMGMAVGAGLRHMNERWGWPVFYDPEKKVALNALANELGKPGALVVNKKGKRILNEAGPYDAVVRAFYSFDTGTYTYVNIPSYVIIDSEHRRRYSLASFPPGTELPKWIYKSDTLEELANLLDIDGRGLHETVKRFNHYARKGQDPDFHRGESDFDIITGGDVDREDLLNPCIAPLGEPPFYGTSIWPGALGTSGGLHINSHSQVLNVWGKTIPGLYAVGNTAGSPLGGGYPGGGGTLSAGLTFAFIAANHIILGVRSQVQPDNG